MWVFDVLVRCLGLDEMHTKHPQTPILTQQTFTILSTLFFSNSLAPSYSVRTIKGYTVECMYHNLQGKIPLP